MGLEQSSLLGASVWSQVTTKLPSSFICPEQLQCGGLSAALGTCP